MAVALPIYLDNHATTPCDPRVLEAMVPYFTEHFGNAASRSHAFGYRANAAVEKARTQLGQLVGADPKEILWTSGATESNNIALLGTARARRKRGTHVITVATEHKAVLDPCSQLEKEGFRVTRLPVDAGGRIRLEDLEDEIGPDTILVSVMAANNEIGTLQPLAEIGHLCRERGVVFHTDAAQATGKIPLDVQEMHIDLMSLSGHKFYGPKGIGALYVRRGRPWLKLDPVMYGGGHERGLRSGTLPVPLIVGMGHAAALCAEEIDSNALQELARLRDRLWAGIRERITDVAVNGTMDHRLPNNLNVSFHGVEAEALMMAIREVACSSGSACTSATLEPSHVLRALGVDGEATHTAVRFGVGRFNTEAEIDWVVNHLAEKVPMLRAMNPLNEPGEGGTDLRTIRWSDSLS
ncbi:MAG: IscS subfamily cysteine desulfurase [Deltaproteobacteria bacterium]|nr:IscS subfamily cysteine desulfurase [Deltaproteobacteria bacterium]